VRLREGGWLPCNETTRYVRFPTRVNTREGEQMKGTKRHTPEQIARSLADEPPQVPCTPRYV
jgi:hypothetical protein